MASATDTYTTSAQDCGYWRPLGPGHQTVPRQPAGVSERAADAPWPPTEFGDLKD